MRELAVALSLAAVSGAAWAQDANPSHQLTSPVPGGRFEIVQSPLAAKWTFRLDRYTGRVWQLVKTKEDDNSWEEMPVENLPKGSGQAKPRFQLFSSGIAARFTFLLDAETGRTWVVVTGKRKRSDGTEYEVSRWAAFDE